MNHYKLYIFDWDGTLMDSVGRIVSSMQAAAKIADLSVPHVDSAKGIIGMSLLLAIDKLFPTASDEQKQAVFQHYKQQYLEVNQTPTSLFNHSVTMLETLNNREKIVTVATGKARAGLERVWLETDTKHLFHASRTADEAESKPHPDMIFQLLDEFDVAAKDAVMIGDSMFDLKMAQAAGVDSIGVTMGAATREALSQYSPLAIVDSVSELSALVT